MIHRTKPDKRGTGKPAAIFLGIPGGLVGISGLGGDSRRDYVALVVARSAMMSVMSELSGVSDMSGMLDVAQVARVLGLSKPTVRRMAAAGRLPNYRPGHAYKVDPVDLAEFVKKSRTDCADAAESAAGAEDRAKTGVVV